jgi:hypothetical protein
MVPPGQPSTAGGSQGLREPTSKPYNPRTQPSTGQANPRPKCPCPSVHAELTAGRAGRTCGSYQISILSYLSYPIISYPSYRRHALPPRFTVVSGRPWCGKPLNL